MTELTNAAYDAYAVIGPQIPRLEHELSDLQGFAERIQLIEERLVSTLVGDALTDPVAIAANSLFASNGRSLLKLSREHILRAQRLDSALIASLEKDPLLSDRLRLLQNHPGSGPDHGPHLGTGDRRLHAGFDR